MFRRLFPLLVVLPALLLAGRSVTADMPPPATTASGVLTIVHSDPQNPLDPAIESFYLATETGDQVELQLGDLDPMVAGLYSLVGLPVTVTGTPVDTPTTTQEATGPSAVWNVTSVRSTAAVTPRTGNLKWLTLACKFADVPDEPRDMAYFQNMYASTYPGLDHYWREASNDLMNVTGSRALGWYTLPKPKSAYQIDYSHLRWTDLFYDCATLADAEVNFNDYFGVHLMLNQSAHCCATATTTYVTLDGVTRSRPVTFIPPWGYGRITTVQHEMAHGLGLWWHSFLGQNEYGDPWDVLGSSNMKCGPGEASWDPVYGCVGQHTQIFNRDYLGWVPPERKVVVAPGETTLSIERATRPPATGYLLAVVPINGSATHYYTIEARQLVGYDVKLAGPSIVIHEFGGSQFLRLMDPPASAGRQFHFWAVGDTWYAPVGNLTIHVDAATATGFRITVNTNWQSRTMTLSPTADTTIDQAAPDTAFGNDLTLRIEGSVANENGTTKGAFLRFDPAQLPARITGAALRMDSTNPDDFTRFEVRPVCKTGGGYGEAWNESTMTWSRFQQDFWQYQPNNPLCLQPGIYVYKPAAYGSDWLEMDITGIIAAGGKNTVGALLVDDDRDYPLKTFSSSEGVEPPQLRVSYLVPDETATTFTPTNDAYVSQARPKNGYGAKPVLQVKDAASDFNTYVKFNVNSISAASVRSATLRLWVIDPGPDGGRVYAVSPFYLNTTTLWLETGLKWNNAPAINGQPLDTAGNAVKGQWVESDVTSAVIAALNSNGRVSLAIVNDSRNLVTYSSKEGAHPPELLVVTD